MEDNQTDKTAHEPILESLQPGASSAVPRAGGGKPHRNRAIIIAVIIIAIIIIGVVSYYALQVSKPVPTIK